MFHLLWTLIKWSLVTVLILAAGQAIHWQGRTLSDQVRIGLAQAERTAWMKETKTWANRSWDRFSKHVPLYSNRLEKRSEREPALLQEPTSSERQKLRALIQELNQGQP